MTLTCLARSTSISAIAARARRPHGDVVSKPVLVPRTPDAIMGGGGLLTVAGRDQARRSGLRVFDATDLPARMRISEN